MEYKPKKHKKTFVPKKTLVIRSPMLRKIAGFQSVDTRRELHRCD